MAGHRILDALETKLTEGLEVKYYDDVALKSKNVEISSF